MKSCARSNCKQLNPQPIEQFGNDKTRSDGKFPHCKSCVKEYRELHKEKRNQQKRIWAEKNREYTREYSKQYYKDHQSQYQDYRNNDKRKEYLRNYQIEHKEQLNKQRSEYRQNRIKIDINYKLSLALRKRFYMALKNNLKGGSAVKDLGCSIPEFKNYIESKFQLGMTWDNWGEWHLDHIKPLSHFNLNDPNEVKIVCHYTNFQPLWAQDNLKKSDKAA